MTVVSSYLLFLLACLLVGITLVVVIRFMLLWRIARTACGAHAPTLPLHVWTIALSYDVLVLGMAVQVYRHPEPWHTVVYLPALVLGIYAMLVLARKQRRPHP